MLTLPPAAMGRVRSLMLAFTGPGRPLPLLPPPLALLLALPPLPPSKSPSYPSSSGFPLSFAPRDAAARRARATGGRNVACRRHREQPNMPDHCKANIYPVTDSSRRDPAIERGRAKEVGFVILGAVPPVREGFGVVHLTLRLVNGGDLLEKLSPSCVSCVCFGSNDRKRTARKGAEECSCSCLMFPLRSKVKGCTYLSSNSLVY